MKEFIVLVLIALTPIAFSQQIGPSWQSFYFTLQHNYYEYIPIELPGYETVFLNLTSNVPVDLYVMNEQEFVQFNETQVFNQYIFHESGTSVQGSVKAAGLVYLVIVNDISRSVAFVHLSYRLGAVDPFYTSSPPVPTGIADYGIKNESGVIVPYEVFARSVTGFADIFKMKAYNSTPPANASAYGAGLQLNVMLQINSSSGTQNYWLQNVAGFTTNNDTAAFWENVWNSTAYDAYLNP
ncbi:MAG: thermopsin family protease, partial [Conexivisphaerales archaeon]|nr:thermopsin family protease [Conexivisphaerales archaeon]